MQQQGIYLEMDLDNHQQDLLLQLFTGSHVPASLVGMVRNFQKECIEQGIENKLNLKESLVKCCEIQIGAIHLDLSTLSEEKVKKCLEVGGQAEKKVGVKSEENQRNEENEQISGQIAWRFTGVNQFGAVAIHIKGRSWQVEFSRLQQRISALITDEAGLKPKAHKALYEKMKKTLRLLAASDLSQILILQGAPGLGKSHCTEHYFYHDAHQRHQMVAWLSGESQEAFLRDWQALADQLRCIDSKRKDDTHTIRHWCEKQLGQWLFIVDDAQIGIDWLKKYLPRKGGHVLITTAQPSHNFPQAAKILSFSPLSVDDSVLLLKAWLGKYWEAMGFAKETQALNYFSKALGGWPSLLTQIALLVRKKGLSFERVMTQFQATETRHLLLMDTLFDQLKGRTFLDGVKKIWRQWIVALSNYYPQLTSQEHAAHLGQFILFLKQEVAQALEKAPQVCVNEELITDYWQGVWASSSCGPLDAQQIATYLNLLPFSYDKANQCWVVSAAGFHALAYHQHSEKDLSPTLPEVTAASALHKEKSDSPQVPSSVSLSFDLENSALGYAEITILTTGKPAEFTAWRLPMPNPYFIPRPALTKEIAEKLPSRQTREKSTELVLAAASGMGGIGKTELAKHFITEPLLCSQYKRRFWFNAVSNAALRNEFYDLARYLGLIELKEYLEDKVLIHRIHGWLNLNPGWLMILDNADEYNGIAEWIPREGGAVLITTREPNPGILTDEKIIKVPLLTPEEAIIWLYRLAQRDQNATTETEQKAARELVENLGCLPLAIAQVAAYLREQKKVSIEVYQQNFLELLLKDKSLIEQDKPIDKKSDTYSRRVIASTWKLSLRMIEAYAKKKDQFNACPWLLTACSYLAPKDIPLGLLEYWFRAFFDLHDIPPSLLSYLIDEYTTQLSRYSLCERSGLTSMISMHRLMQKVLRSSLTQELSLLMEPEKLSVEIKYLGGKIRQKGVSGKKVFVSLIGVLIEYSAEFTSSIEDMKRRIELISHLQVIIATWEALNYQDEVNPKILIELYGRLAAIQLELCADAKAGLVPCKKQLDLGRKYYGPEHPEVAITLINLGTAYADLGDAQQQKCLLEKALRINEHYYGPEHFEVARTLNNLGVIYGDLGDAQQQKDLLTRVLPILERHYGLEHPEVAMALSNLGNAYGALGDNQEQKRLLERALPILEQHYGPVHPHVAKTLVNLGTVYNALGDAQQQQNLLKQVLPLLEQHHNSEHPQVARLIRQNIACDALSYAQQQKDLMERVLPIFQYHYGTDHLHVANVLLCLGAIYGALGDAYQQRDLLERAVPILEQHYGLEHPKVAKTLANLSDAYGALGNVQQQKSLLERASRISEQQLFAAVVAGDLNTIQAIIAKQPFLINSQEKNSQRTALHLACISQQREITAYLLSKLACFDIKDKEEKFAWEYVINTPLLELFKNTTALFAQKYSVAVNTGIYLNWEKILRMAVASNFLADVRFLIEVKGIDVNSVDANPKTGYTALHLTVIRNKPQIAKYLISKGADVHVLDASKKRPLDYLKPRQKELLTLFNLSVSDISAEDCGLNFEKLHL